jgi:hypothetical protein
MEKGIKMVAMRLEGCLIHVGRKTSEINGKLLVMASRNISPITAAISANNI